MSNQNRPRPDHARKISTNRVAIAPYNFVRLPDKIVPADTQSPSHASYAGLTGRIECTLRTASPTYVRCALSIDKFEQAEREREQPNPNYADAAKNSPDFFYTAIPSEPVIPGSSLRGMLRALIEIAGFGKMQFVDSQRRFFFRAVADNPTTSSIGSAYKKIVNQPVQAGYLCRDDNGWHICEAEGICGQTFCWYRPDEKGKSILKKLGVSLFSDSDFEIKYLPIKFSNPFKSNLRFITENINNPSNCPREGTLTYSGNMLETNSGPSKSPRHYYCIVFNQGTTRHQIDSQAIEDYLSGLTEFQKSEPFDAEKGLLHPGRPVFFVRPTKGKEVVYFGQSPNFRIPYRQEQKDASHATSAVDAIPASVRADQPVLDLAEAIFGYVRSNQANSALAGRVFFSNAHWSPEHADDDPFLIPENEALTPHILSSPKPTTFQHYLVQPDAEKANLRHYASPDAEIRGHKLYWHQGNLATGEQANSARTHLSASAEKVEASPMQYTQIRPVKTDTAFTFTLRFENLSEVELGALLWVLEIGGSEQYRLKLGMGKPLGMGSIAVETTSVVFDDRIARYQTLFEDGGWAEPVLNQPPDARAAFIEYMSTQLDTAFEEHPRIQELLTMLEWRNGEDLTFNGSTKPSSALRYMEIKRSRQASHLPEPERKDRKEDVNEYSERRVLPLPCQVAGKPCDEPQAKPADNRVATNTALPTKSASQSSALHPPSQQRQIGDVFTAEVLQIAEDGVKIAIPHKTEQQALAFMKAEDCMGKQYRVGNPARVQIIAIRQGTPIIYAVRAADPKPKRKDQ